MNGASAADTAPPTGLVNDCKTLTSRNPHPGILEHYLSPFDKHIHLLLQQAAAQFQGNKKCENRFKKVGNLHSAAWPLGLVVGPGAGVRLPGVTERTTTGFSLPATNPKPSTGSRLISTFLGAGGTNLSPSRRTSSRELLWDT